MSHVLLRRVTAIDRKAFYLTFGKRLLCSRQFEMAPKRDVSNSESEFSYSEDEPAEVKPLDKLSYPYSIESKRSDEQRKLSKKRKSYPQRCLLYFKRNTR